MEAVVPKDGDHLEPVVFKFKLTVQDYRKMSYFNSFSTKRIQMFLIIFCWVSSLLLLPLDLLGFIHPTEMMHLCFIIVSLTVPVMVLAVEMNVRRFKNTVDGESGMRTMMLSEQGVKPRSGYGLPMEPWSSFMAVYETKSMFILYKDANRTMLIPKSNESPEKLEAARNYFQTQLNGHFKTRL